MTVDPQTPPTVPPDSLKAKLPSSNGDSATGAKTELRHAGGRRYQGVELWLHRFTVLTFGFVCVVVGVLLLIIPWRPEWTDNRLLLAFPGLRAIVASGFVRGICSGLGMLDIWIGFSEALHYHEGKRP